MTVADKTATVSAVWPLLVVKDLETSLAFYRDRLGFSLQRGAEADGRLFWCRISRGGASLMLQAWHQEDGPVEGRGRGVTLYFLCDDADALYAEFVSRGVALEPPTTAYYGMRQLFVPEPDGYVVCFESDAGS